MKYCSCYLFVVYCDAVIRTDYMALDDMISKQSIAADVKGSNCA
jgi:hypothetical protein